MDRGFNIHIDQSNAQPPNINAFEGQNNYFIHITNTSIEFYLKGVVLNFKDLYQKNNSFSEEELIQKLYLKKGNLFTSDFAGEYCGFLYDKLSDKIIIFTNPIGSQSVFYYIKDQHIVIDSDLFRLKDQLQLKRLSYSFNLNAAYVFLTCSFIPDNQTLVNEIQKLSSGEHIEFDLKHQKTISYFVNDFDNLQPTKKSKNAVLSDLDDLFKVAVRQEFEFDKERNKKHFSLLSGGLDSRLNFIYAYDLGYKTDLALCFSHSNYWDEKIAKKIAKDYETSINTVHLDKGDFLVEIDKVTEELNGLICYTSGVHSSYALSQMNFKDFGLIHSGHLGDAVLGSYLSSSHVNPPHTSLGKLIKNKRFLPKIESYLTSFVRSFPNEEIFLLKTRGFNLIVAGAKIAESHAIQTSPFMHKDFLNYALAIPNNWRLNQRIYIDWINRFKFAATRYKWERTLMKPNAKWKTEFGSKVNQRIFKQFYINLMNRPDKAFMVNYSYYFENNSDVINFFNQFFRDHISLITNLELKKDLELMFQQGNFYEKSVVLSLLSIYKKLF